MSLINDMLRDLDAKRPDDPARLNLQREIRSLPRAPRRAVSLPRLALLTGLPTIGIAAAWLHLNGQLLPWFGATLAAPPEAVVEAPAPAPAAKLQPEPSELRAAESLAVVPVAAEPLLPVPDPLAPKAAAAPSPAAESSPAAAAAQSVVQAGAPSSTLVSPPPPAASGASAAAAPVRIEKVPALATPRDRADSEFHRAEAALAAGRPAEAVEALRAALKQDPGHVQARQLLLRQLLEQRKTGEVVVILQEGVELLPQQTGWAMSLARLQLERGDLAAAEATLARSQSFAEASADYAGFMGHLKTRQGEHRQAIPLYARATRLAPDEGRWWLGLGLAQEADGRLQDARESLRRALATGRLSAELVAVAEQHLR